MLTGVIGAAGGRRSVRLWLLGVVVLCGAGGLAMFAFAGPSVPTPLITGAPASHTRLTSARLSFRDPERGVRLQCSIGTARFSDCASPVVFPGRLHLGWHTFRVRAQTRSGQLSSLARYRWLIDRRAPSVSLVFPANGGSYDAAHWDAGCLHGAPGLCGRASDPSGVRRVMVSIRQRAGEWWGGHSFDKRRAFFIAATGTRNWRYPLAVPVLDGRYTVRVRATDRLGNTTSRAARASTRPAGPAASFTIIPSPSPTPPTTGPGQQLPGVAFSITGSAPASLYPGAPAAAIPVTLENPNSAAITVTNVTATLNASGVPAGCQAGWFAIGQSNISASQPVTVPANGSVTLPAQGASAPTIQLTDSHTNQDACQNAHLTLTYTGSAHS